MSTEAIAVPASHRAALKDCEEERLAEYLRRHMERARLTKGA